MAVIRKYISYFIVALVALQVLNLGLYAQDFTTIARDANGAKPNIINSVTEYVAEVILEKKNAFPERKEKSNQSEHEVTYKFQPFKIYASTVHSSVPVVLVLNRHYEIFTVNQYSNHTTDITSPPPRYQA